MGLQEKKVYHTRSVKTAMNDGMGTWMRSRAKKWTGITKGNKITKRVAPYYVHLSNAYAQLEKFSADLSPPPSEDKTSTTTKTSNQ